MRTAIRIRPLLCVGLLCLGSCLGCAGSNFVPSKLPGLPESSVKTLDVSKSPSGGLPPKETARACMVTAEELENNGHVEQAVLLYERARANDPGLKDVSHRLAALYDQEGNSPRSFSEYTKALKADPKNPDLLNDFGYYHYRRGNFPEAEAWFRKALSVDANHPKALANLALVLAEQGKFDESFETFSKVVGPAAAYSNLGVLMARQGRCDQAKQAFRQALAMDSALRQPQAFLDYLEGRQRSEQGQPISVLPKD